MEKCSSPNAENPWFEHREWGEMDMCKMSEISMSLECFLKPSSLKLTHIWVENIFQLKELDWLGSDFYLTLGRTGPNPQCFFQHLIGFQITLLSWIWTCPESMSFSNYDIFMHFFFVVNSLGQDGFKDAFVICQKQELLL